MTTNIYTETATKTEIISILESENKMLKIVNGVMVMVMLIVSFFVVMSFALGYRFYLDVSSPCPAPNYNLCLPEPVPTPIQK